MSNIRVLIKQIHSSERVEDNEKAILNILNEQFDVAIFPELFYSGYLHRDNLNLRVLEPEFVEELMGKVGDRLIIFGAPVMDQFLYNSAVAVGKSEVNIYRKMHPPNFGPFEELRYFKRGNSPLTINFRGFNIGIQICYDLFFQDTLQKGLDLIINISASPFTSYPYFERTLPARAIENQSFVIYVNTVGLQRNLVFWGGSRVLNPDGREIISFGKFVEESRLATIDREEVDIARRKRKVLEEVWDVYKE
ncbi:MAG: carbon-nitrogen hydrolase family protein [Thermoplasmatales archaeon]